MGIFLCVSSAACEKVLQDTRGQGFQPVFRRNLNGSILRNTEERSGKELQNLTPLTPGSLVIPFCAGTLQNPFFTDLFELLKSLTYPLEGLHTETRTRRTGSRHCARSF